MAADGELREDAIAALAILNTPLADTDMDTVVHPIELPHGVTLQYAQHGVSSGTPVVLLHGATDSWYSFALVLPELPSSICAFALTQRGHGDSSRPTAGYHYPDFARDIAAFMDAMEIPAAVIVGHSMGRAVAQRFAIDYPERVLGLVLIGAFAGGAGNPIVAELNTTVQTLVDPVDPVFVREFQSGTLAQPVPPDFLDAVVRESLKVPARVWHELFAAILEDDAVAGLGTIAVPALIVSGGRDDFAPLDEVEACAREIAGARLVIYEGAGHGLHWEEPTRFAADLAAFVRDLRSD